MVHAAAASLLLAHKPHGQRLLLVGDGALVRARTRAALDAGLDVDIVWHTPLDSAPRVRTHLVDHDMLFPPSEDACAAAWDDLLDTIDTDDRLLFAVAITDTLADAQVQTDTQRRSWRCAVVARACRRRRLPINVTDVPDLCDFSFPATHRFAHDDEHPSALQLAVTTNGRGCRLAARLRRQIVSALPPSAGRAVDRIGEMRDIAKAADDGACDLEDEPGLGASLGYGAAARSQRDRMRWIAQISEYWPIDELARLTPDTMHTLLAQKRDAPADTPHDKWPSQHDLTLERPSGHVYLLGSGPGHPDLLTVMARDILTSPATDLVLSDKLVPTAVLALIPHTTPLVIAKKFPGNADGAQSELIAQALDAARRGLRVVRLKQGDPYIYGRGGEEYVACKNAHIPCTVVPGISSALAGPLLFHIPITQRGAAESMTLCTGVGRGGRQVSLPGYERARTLVLLMGVARLAAVMETLQAPLHPGRAGAPYPPYTPIAVIERASSDDQRMITSTIDHIAYVMEHHITDGQRPPAMLVIGWAVPSLAGPVAGGRILDDALEVHETLGSEPSLATAELERRDRDRVAAWLGARRFGVSEGLPPGYARVDEPAEVPAERPENAAAHAPRSLSGWAAPRYGSGAPTDGWTPGEKVTQDTARE